MTADDPRVWMWTEACALLERAEHLNRQFFSLNLSGAQAATWQPPVDVFETKNEVWVVAALPGVERQDLEVSFGADTLVIAGRRPLPRTARDVAIHRLEIPYGRFERRLRLSSTGLQLGEPRLVSGCLVLSLAKRN